MISNINKTIDHTNLKPNANQEDFLKLCNEAIVYDFKCVCVPPYWVEYCSCQLVDSTIQVCTVIGFPFGYTTTKSKLFEAMTVLESGADEIDLVVNIAAIKSKNWIEVNTEIRKINELAVSKKKLLKVIFETGYLLESEIIELCKICTDIGVGYVKTSTGFGPSGASPEHVKLMKANIGANVKIKASGGIKNLENCITMFDAGASRIGTSSSVEIIKEYYIMNQV